MGLLAGALFLQLTEQRQDISLTGVGFVLIYLSNFLEFSGRLPLSLVNVPTLFRRRI